MTEAKLIAEHYNVASCLKALVICYDSNLDNSVSVVNLKEDIIGIYDYNPALASRQGMVEKSQKV